MELTPPPSPSPQSTYAPPRPGASSTTVIVLTVLMWIAWVIVLLIADLLGFLMFAFADSPGGGRAAQAMIVPAFVWFGITFVAGVILLLRRVWWRIVLAFVLAVSPPFVIFLGYNLLDNPSRTYPASYNPATVPAVTPGGYVPPPPPKVREQPDFQKTIDRYTASRPSPATQP